MKKFKGKSVSSGYAEGKVFIYRPEVDINTFFRKISPDHIKNEIKRFEIAIESSINELKHLRHKVASEIGESESGIFSAHLALLNDSEFFSKVKMQVEKEHVNIEFAIANEIEVMEKLLLGLKNEYLRERHQDIRDVGNRLLKHLKYPDGVEGNLLSQLPSNTILVTVELLPSDTIQLDRENIYAIVTERSGAQSHAVILARTLGIPFITAISEITKKVKSGEWIQVDARRGEVIIAPSRKTKKGFMLKKHQYDDILMNEVRDESKECITKDGIKVDLYANIGRVDETAEIRRHYLQGVGLFRTEYLFLNGSKIPNLSIQTRAYRDVAMSLDGLPLVIRTLDLGGDKQPAFLSREIEDNPNLGYRGLRFSLGESKKFKTQIRAILRASKYGDIRLMFPMVAGFEDLRSAIEIIQQIAYNEKISVIPQIGSMIEIPSAVFEIEEILDLVDFVSIGTNDLTQFMLATDRNAILMLDSFSTLCPAVLRAISKVIKAANKKRKNVCICGEIAGEPDAACLLVGMGIKHLSMSPVRAAKIRHCIRSNYFSDFVKLSEKVEKCVDVKSIRNELKLFNSD